jgi:ABC-type multidrug transport system fused ATPase/permease subunit
MTDDDTTTEAPAPPPSTSELRGGRMNTVGVPTEKSKDFANSSKRLFNRLGPERPKAYLVLVLAVVSVGLVVSGPKILGHATNLLYEGLVRRARGTGGVDFAALHLTLWVAVGLYLLGYLLSYLQAYVLAGVVQRTMFRLRADVEAKLHRVPLSYLDRQARGDLLSRVTNDIDNVAQSMQQSLSQLLSGVLTIVGTIAMMLWISWQLAIVAIVTVPISILVMKRIAGYSRGKFMAQWKHTGALNAQVEEAFTGHPLVKAFGRQREAQARFDATNEELFRGRLRGAVHQRLRAAGDDASSATSTTSPSPCSVACKVANGSLGSATCRRSSSTRASSRSRSRRPRRWSTCCSRASPPPSGCSSCSTLPSRPTRTRRAGTPNIRAARSSSATCRSATTRPTRR